MNICTKYGFDILIISGSYGGHRQHTTYDGRRTTPRVLHKLPTGELKIYSIQLCYIIGKFNTKGLKVLIISVNCLSHHLTMGIFDSR